MKVVKSITLLIALISTLISLKLAYAEEDEKLRLVTQKVNDSFYLVYEMAEGSNVVGVLIEEEGIMLIDSFPPSHSKILLEEIRKISDKPVKYVLPTHSHGDHSGGLNFFAKMGATTISQENSVYHYGGRAKLRFKDELILDFGDEQVKAFHQPSHTFDDTIIYLEKSNILFMGDNLSTDRFLSIGEKGLAGHLSAFDLGLSLADEKTRVVPGHSALSSVKSGNITLNKKDLLSYKQKSIDWVERLKDLYNKGFTIEQMKQDETLIKLTRSFVANANNIKDPEHDFGMDWSVDKAIDLEFNQHHTLSEVQLKNFVGTYSLDKDINVDIFMENKKLFARKKGRYLVELLLLTSDVFDLKGYFFAGQNEKFRFNRNKAGVIESMEVIVDEKSIWAQYPVIVRGTRQKL